MRLLAERGGITAHVTAVRLSSHSHPALAGQSIISISPPMAKLIFGCGYLGLRVAQLWRAVGHAVFAVTRSNERAAKLAAAGV